MYVCVRNGLWLTHSDINKVKVISELLCIRHSYVNLECFNSEDIDFMIEFNVYRLGLAHSLYVWFYFFNFLVYSCTIFMFININRGEQCKPL